MITERFFINNEWAAIIQMNRVNQKGEEVSNGKYIYIRNLFIVPKYRNYKFIKYVIRQAVKRMGQQMGDFTFTYWNRKKYNNRPSQYKISNLTKGETNEFKEIYINPCTTATERPAIR